MNSRQRAYLKSLASNIDSVFQIGKSTLTPEITEAVKECFNTRELIKITILKNCIADYNELAATLAERTGSEVVQVIGRKIVLFKQDKKNGKIELPR